MHMKSFNDLRHGTQALTKDGGRRRDQALAELLVQRLPSSRLHCPCEGLLLELSTANYGVASAWFGLGRRICSPWVLW